MNEHSFIRAVHAHLPPELFRWKIHDTFAGGVPDAFYAGPASTLFVEYKYVKALPKRDSSVLRTTLTPQQIQWLNRLYSLNQPTALINGCEKLALVITDGQWIQEPNRNDFIKRAVTFQAAANWINSVCTDRLRRKRNERSERAASSHQPAANLESEKV